MRSMNYHVGGGGGYFFFILVLINILLINTYTSASPLHQTQKESPFGFWYLGGGVPRPRLNRAGRGTAPEPLSSSGGVHEEQITGMSSSTNLKSFLRRPSLASHLKYFLADDVRQKRDGGRPGEGFHIKKTVIPIPRLG